MSFKKDKWLSNIFKKPVWTVKDKLDTIDNMNILSNNGFAYYKNSINNEQSIPKLGALGFDLIETNLIFKLKNKNFVQCFDKESFGNIKFIEKGIINDSTKLQQKEVCLIASQSFTQSRFHKDRKIDFDTACIVKHEWVKNFFYGNRGDAMVIAENENKQIIGFLLLILGNNNHWYIDLIAVDSYYRGKNIATKMFLYFIESSKLDQDQSILVGTQLSNNISIKLYEKLGFIYYGANYVYHSHW